MLVLDMISSSEATHTNVGRCCNRKRDMDAGTGGIALGGPGDGLWLRIRTFL